MRNAAFSARDANHATAAPKSAPNRKSAKASTTIVVIP
jgi:hypothetical protein